MSHPAAQLKELEGHAKKRFGQHFLASPTVVEQIVTLAGVTPGQPVLEIGPGLGVLTEALLGAGAAVTAVELDRDLAGWLRGRFAAPLAQGQLRLVEGDAARMELGALLPPGAWCVANLPYNVGTRLVVQMLAQPARFARLVVMLQREVALRLAAPPGDRARGSLSVYAQARADIRPLLRVPPGAFHPPPRVESAVIALDLRPAPALGGASEAGFEAVVQAAFAQPRRTLRRNLADAYGVEAAERALSLAAVDPAARPATLDLAAFARLSLALEPAA